VPEPRNSHANDRNIDVGAGHRRRVKPFGGSRPRHSRGLSRSGQSCVWRRPGRPGLHSSLTLLWAEAPDEDQRAALDVARYRRRHVRSAVILAPGRRRRLAPRRSRRPASRTSPAWPRGLERSAVSIPCQGRHAGSTSRSGHRWRRPCWLVPRHQMMRIDHGSHQQSERPAAKCSAVLPVGFGVDGPPDVPFSCPGDDKSHPRTKYLGTHPSRSPRCVSRAWGWCKWPAGAAKACH
jgi:hypothetical protein